MLIFRAYKQMTNLRNCSLCCVKTRKAINLPHNEVVVVGRNKITGIEDTILSRNQVKLVANVHSCIVQVVPVGVNPSGVNGFSLKRHKEYILNHKDRLELLLDQYIYEIIFDPAPEKSNEAKDSSSGTKSKRTNDSDIEGSAKKQLKLDNSKQKKSEWEEVSNKLLLIYTTEGLTSSKKIAAYDVDGTIITTKSGARFPKDAEDWKFAFAEVPKKIRALYKDGYKIVFFTNQAGIGLGKVKVNEIKQKIEKIIQHLAVPVQVFISTGKGVYRKPAPGMWDALCNEKNHNFEIDLTASFYCGDAAGREKNWAPKMKKDHSIADRLFALNIGLPFETPEQHFLGARKVPFIMPEFDPRTIKNQPLLVPESSQLSSDKQEVIIFVGSPGSGKSYVCKNLLVPKGYVHINRDQLGSWQKCVSALEAALQKKQSVVVDNTNPDKESRKRYLAVTNKHQIPCRCFVMATTIHQAKHNNLFREITDKQHVVVTDIVINSYKNKYEEPVLDEGFTEVVKVNCNPKFDNPEHDRLYHVFLLEK